MGVLFQNYLKLSKTCLRLFTHTYPFILTKTIHGIDGPSFIEPLAYNIDWKLFLWANQFEDFFSVFCFVLLLLGGGVWLHSWHMEVPGPGIKSKLQLQCTPQPQQCWILNPLRQAGDQTCASAAT